MLEQRRRFPVRLLRWFAAAVAIAAGLLLVTVGALHLPAAQRFVIAQVFERLRAQQIQVTASHVSYNLAALSLLIDDARVSSLRTPDLPVFATVAHARVNLSTWALIGGRYEIDAASASGVSIHYVIAADGSTNLPTPPPHPDLDEPAEVVDYLLRDTLVEQAQVRYEDHVTDLDLTLPIARLGVDGQLATRRHDVTLTAGPGTLVTEGRTIALTALEVTADAGRDDVRVEAATLRAADSRLELSGRVDHFAAPTLALDLQADLDAAGVLAAAGVREPARGRVTVRAAVHGPVDTATVTATASSNALAVRDLAPASLVLRGGYARAEGRGTLEALELTAPWGRVSGNGAVALAGGDSHLALRFDGVDAEALSTALALPVRVATRLSGDVDARMPALDYTAASGRADLMLAATRRAPQTDVLPVNGVVHVTADRGNVAARIERVEALGATLRGRVRLGDGEALSGNVTIATADAAVVLRAAEAFLGERAGTLAPMPVAGAVTIAASLSGNVAAPAVRATVTAPGLAIGDLRDVAVTAAAEASRTAVQIATARVDWGEATVTASGRASLTGHRTVQAQAKAEALAVPALLKAMSLADTPAAGTLSARLDVNGTLDRPAARMTLRGVDLVAYSEPLGTLTFDAQLEGRVARLDTATLEKPQANGTGWLHATGTYALDGRAYTVELSSRDLRIEQLVLPDGTTARGEVTLNGQGRGTIADPAGAIELESGGLTVGERDYGPLTARVALADRQATFAAGAPRFATSARGTVGIDAPYAGRADVTVDGLAIEALPLQLDTPLTGTVRARLHAEGPAARPADATVTGTLESLDARWNDQPITLTAPAAIALAERVVTVDRLHLSALDSTATLSGQIPLDAAATPGQIDVDANLHLATLAGYAPRGVAVNADGTLRVQGRLTGSAAAIDPDLTLQLEGGQVMTAALGAPITGVAIDARVAGGTASLQRLDATWGAARLAAAAHAPLSFLGTLPVALPAGTGRATVEARLSGLDLAALPGAPAGVTGRIDAQLQGSAASADPAALEGQLTFDALELGFRGLTLTQQRPSRLSASGGVATVEALTLTGSAGAVTAAGTVTLTGDQPLDVHTEGTLDLAVLSVVTDVAQARGPMRFDVRADGPAAQPQVHGFAELDGGSIVTAYPADVAVEDLDARVDLDGAQVTLSRLAGLVNGGTLSGSGTVTLGADVIADADLQLAIDDLAFSAPLDLRSQSDVALRLTRRGDDFVVAGDVRIAEAGLTGDINFDTGVLGAIGRPRGLDLTDERSALLERMRFDVRVNTGTPILIDNNLAQAELTTNVTVLGTPYDLGMSGRMELLAGSAVTLNERRYQVERGRITFTDDRRITPSFDLQLTTSARNYDVTLGVTGEVGATETTLTSNPALPEPDIMALLVTGRTLDDMRGEEYDVAREQVLSYLTGRVGAQLGRGIERATGLSEVRVEPNLIANEADPGARLTVGQDITDAFRLIYSTDLADSNNQIWVAEYDLTKRFETRAVRQRDNTYRVEFRHDVRFGGDPEPRRQPRVQPVIVSVAILVDGAAAEPAQLDRLDLTPGQSYDFFAAREGIDRLEADLREQGFLQSRVRLRRTDAVAPAATDGREVKGVAVEVEVTRGPHVRVQYDGVTPPRKVQRDIAVRWQRGVFDSQRTGDVVSALQGWLMAERHMDPHLTVTVEDDASGDRIVHVQAEPGPRFAKVTLVFEGAQGIAPETLDGIVRDQHLEEDLFTDPAVVTELLRRYYREEGYLAATLDEPVREFAGDTARVVIRVHEGPRFVVAGLTATGNGAVATPVLLDEAPLRPGEPFLPAVAERSLDRIRQLYWRRGYNDVRLTYDVQADRESGRADVSIQVREGARAVVNTIAVRGTDRTSDDLVLGQLELAPDGVLDVAAVGRSRRNLYATGAYTVVEFARVPVAQPPGEPSADLPVDVHVSVREVQPFQLGYGASYDTERGLGGVLELTNSNSLGWARQVGVSTRYDSQLRQARAFISQPFLKRFPLQTTAAVYLRQERNPLTEVTQAFDVDRIGATLQQERRFANHYVWNYGARWEQARTIDPRPGRVRDERTTVTPFTSTVTRETRDDVLDATRGTFASQAVSYAPRWLGASAAYLRYYGQYFTYVPLRPPTREPLTNEILRPRLVWATAVRLGLARGIGGPVPFSERFFGGGSTTVRGLAQNALGPRDADEIPAGGAGTLIVNTELRFPVVSIVDGVGFLDVGAVVPQVRDWDWRDLRKAAGLGVRLRTPWFLIRGDYGVVLDRRTGEPRSRFFFSIGQAF